MSLQTDRKSLGRQERANKPPNFLFYAKTPDLPTELHSLFCGCLACPGLQPHSSSWDGRERSSRSARQASCERKRCHLKTLHKVLAGHGRHLTCLPRSFVQRHQELPQLHLAELCFTLTWRPRASNRQTSLKHAMDKPTRPRCTSDAWLFLAPCSKSRIRCPFAPLN